MKRIWGGAVAALCCLQMAWAEPTAFFDQLLVTPKEQWSAQIARSGVSEADLRLQWPRVQELVKKGDLARAVDLAKAMDEVQGYLSKSYTGNAQVSLATQLHRAGQDPLALQLASALRCEHPKLSAGYLLEAVLTADPAAGLALLEQARPLSTDPDERELLFLAIADKELRLNDLPKARSAFEEVLKLNPNNGLARDAVAQLKEGMELRKALGSPAETAFERAEEAFRKGLYTQALSHYEEAVRLSPEMEKAWLYRGDALLQLGRIDDALESYRKAVALDPKDKQAFRFLGDTLARKAEQSGDTALLQEAVRCLETAVQLDPNYQAAQSDLKALRARLAR